MLATSTQFFAQIASTSYDYINASGPFFWLMVYGLVGIVCAFGVILALVRSGSIVFGYSRRSRR